MNILSQVEGGARRLSEIIAVLVKFGIADWLNNVDNEWIARRLRNRHGEDLTHRPHEERIRLALTELGTTAIKLGQMLSTRPDVIGATLAAELSKLQTSTPPDAPETVFALLRRELGDRMEQNFYSIEKEPIASASIGQVHRAELISGEQVVLKVIHEGIIEKVHRDLAILMFLAEQMEKYAPALRPYRPVATVRYFRKTILRELNFASEKQCVEQFAKNFQSDPSVRFPLVYPALCTTRLLVMEWMDGIPMTDPDAVALNCEDLPAFARHAADVFIRMIFQHGFYHADPHPGNLFLLPGDVLAIVDCGMTGRIDENYREELEALMLAAAANDPEELADVICRISFLPSKLDRSELVADLGDILSDYANQSFDHFDITGALNQITNLIWNHRLVLHQSFAMIIKTIIMLEGTARKISPDFTIAELLRPYQRHALLRHFNPPRLAQKTIKSWRDWSRLLENLPADLSSLVNRIRDGTFEVHLEHRHLEETVDRLVKGVLTASLFLGSSLMLSFDVPPAVAGVSVPGLLCILASAFFGLRLFRVISKRTRRR